MRCSEIRELLALHADGSLDDKNTRRVQTHLFDCPDCQEELVYLKKTLALLKGQVVDPPVPARLHQHIMKEIGQERKKREKSSRVGWLYFPRQISAVAAVFLMLFVGGNFFLAARNPWMMTSGSDDVGMMESQVPPGDEGFIALEEGERKAGDLAHAEPPHRPDHRMKNVVLYNAALLIMGSGLLWYYFKGKKDISRDSGD